MALGSFLGLGGKALRGMGRNWKKAAGVAGGAGLATAAVASQIPRGRESEGFAMAQEIAELQRQGYTLEEAIEMVNQKVRDV